jgi:hypothetical protein
MVSTISRGIDESLDAQEVLPRHGRLMSLRRGSSMASMYSTGVVAAVGLNTTEVCAAEACRAASDPEGPSPCP